MPNKPSKKWWDEKVKEVKSGNPDYTKEQVDKTVGDIFFHKLSPSEKEKAMSHSSHLVKAINLIAEPDTPKKTEWDFGYEFAEAMEGEEGYDTPVDIKEMLGSTVSIPTEDYRMMEQYGIENPNAKEYWKGFNAYIEESYPPESPKEDGPGDW